MKFKCSKCGEENDVLLGFQKKGGESRMASITAEERSRNAKKGARTRKLRREANRGKTPESPTP